MTDRQLINLAVQASRNAYVPYSHFAVGRGCSHGVPNASLILDERGWGSVIIAFEKGCQG